MSERSGANTSRHSK